ncbi:hypothetical protein COJ95_20345 [Bacillus cereus]|nr:hypothetical protein COJ95_20345 [Bacillus cereus]
MINLHQSDFNKKNIFYKKNFSFIGNSIHSLHYKIKNLKNSEKYIAEEKVEMVYFITTGNDNIIS